MCLVVRANGDPNRVVNSIRGAIHDIDPDRPMSMLRPCRTWSRNR